MKTSFNKLHFVLLPILVLKPFNGIVEKAVPALEIDVSAEKVLLIHIMPFLNPKRDVLHCSGLEFPRILRMFSEYTELYARLTVPVYCLNLWNIVLINVLQRHRSKYHTLLSCYVILCYVMLLCVVLSSVGLCIPWEEI